MSETAPKPTPFDEALNKFEENKADHDAEKWTQALLENEGSEVEKYSDEHRNQLEEAKAYYQHMEQFSQDDRSAFDRNYDTFSPQEGEIPGTPEHAREQAEAEAHARQDEVEATAAANEAARDAKFASDPNLRRMEMIAQNIAEIGESDPDRLAQLEDKLQESLLKYEASDDYDPAIADEIINHTRVNEDEAAFNELNEVVSPEDASEDEAAFEELDAVRTPGEVVSDEDEAAMKELDDVIIPPTDDPTKSKEEIHESTDSETAELPVVEPEHETSPPEEKSLWKRAKEKLDTVLLKGLVKAMDSAGNGYEKYKDSSVMRRRVALGMVGLVGASLSIFLLTGSSSGGGGSAVATATGGAGGGVPNPTNIPSGYGSGGHTEVFSDVARTVSKGEGWLNTMREAGITDTAKQASILHNDTVMGQLAKMGVAYRAPELGGWGIKMPANGVLPQKALELLTAAAK